MTGVATSDGKMVRPKKVLSSSENNPLLGRAEGCIASNGKYKGIEKTF